MKGIKTGGRSKGTPNKDSTGLAQILDDNNFEPVQEVLKLLPQLDPMQQMNSLLKLIEYVHPKRKAVDLTTNGEAFEAPEITPEMIKAAFDSDPFK